MKGRTYRYFEGEALYPFGHGLSYTRFEYSGLRIAGPRPGPREAFDVTLTVRNSGSRAGDEVVQLYTRAVAPRLPMPLQQLRGFERVSLKPGEERVVTFRLRPEDDMSHYDVASRTFVADPGEYEIRIGASSRDIRLKGLVSVR
jgi:beta-glucosidase